jgi:hypothetical protein
MGKRIILDKGKKTSKLDIRLKPGQIFKTHYSCLNPIKKFIMNQF